MLTLMREYALARIGQEALREQAAAEPVFFESQTIERAGFSRPRKSCNGPIAVPAEGLAHGCRGLATAVVAAFLRVVLVFILRPVHVAACAEGLVGVVRNFVAATDAVASATLPGHSSLWLRSHGCCPQADSQTDPCRMPEPILLCHRDEGFTDLQCLLISIGV